MGLITKGKAAFRKTYPDMRALFTRQYPAFVYGAKSAASASLPVPVFCFHAVEPEGFGALLGYLADNGYRAIDATEWLAIVEKPSDAAGNEVLLTFDDGDVTLYRTAYPLLKKHDYKAVSFICPGLVPADTDAGRDDRMLCTWQEIKEMHDSGVIDFQCHSYNHDLVFTSDNLVGFLNPAFVSPFFGKSDHPIVIQDGEQLTFTNLCSFRGQTAAGHWGTPIYEHKPRMAAPQRYLSAPALRERLTSFVRDNGDEAFFERADWEKLLHDEVKQAGVTTRGETLRGKDYQAHVAQELERSVAAIEANLPGKTVQHLCPPWFVAQEAALQTAEEIGFRAAFLGVEQRAMAERPGAMHRVQRLAFKYVTRLPGSHRSSLLRTVLDRSG